MGTIVYYSFCVYNGVEQGGILVITLFNIYMDTVRTSLNFTNIGGGHIGGPLLIHLCYGDDLCLISMSLAGILRLLNICTEQHSLHYNGRKLSQCAIHPKKPDLKDQYGFR